MKVHKPDNLALLANPCRIGENICLSVGALACFSLDSSASERLLPETELWKTAALHLGRNDSLDMGYPKQRAEFIVYGAAWNTKPKPAVEVRVGVGQSTKALLVTGDRRWRTGGIPSEPEPFLSMPIDYTRAFGGPGYAFNPVGKGFAAQQDGIRPLPNIQYPAKLIASPKDTPPPASLTPYPADWPQRQANLGRFNDQWLAERWPGYPTGTSPEYFNIAPEDQRLSGFFRGDETILLVNMHPEAGRIESSLPGLRARVFVALNSGKGEEFTEVKTRAETLWLYPQELLGVLLYRGVVPVTDEELDDVPWLIADWESTAETEHPPEYYYQRFREAEQPQAEPFPEFPEAAGASVESAPAGTADGAAAAGASAGLPALPPEVDARLAEVKREAAGIEADATERLRALGLTREEAVKKYGLEAAEEPASMESLGKSIAELEAETDKRIKALGLTREELLARYAPPVQEDKVNPAEVIAMSREVLDKARQQMGAAKLDEQTLWNLLPEEVRIDGPPGTAADAEQSLALWESQPPPAADAQETFPGGSRLTAAEVIERHRQGRSFKGIDASGGDFTGCDLRGADFAEANLTGACFSGADLRGASFRQAILQGADFRDADLTGTCLKGAGGPGALLGAAKLENADLSEGDWTGADMTAAALGGADLSRSLFRKAILKKCSAQKICAQSADFSASDLSEADFQESDLTRADCSEAKLDHTRFSLIRAQGLQLFGTACDGTDFGNARLVELRGGMGTVLKNASLKGADLARSSLGGVEFTDADLSGAVLDGSDFSKARFTRVKMVSATARETSFMKAFYEESDLRGFNLFKGSLRKARLENVNLSDANLYGVDFFEAALKSTSLQRTNVQRTLLAMEGSFKR